MDLTAPSTKVELTGNSIVVVTTRTYEAGRSPAVTRKQIGRLLR